MAPTSRRKKAKMAPAEPTAQRARHLAKFRRDQENEEFIALAAELPIPEQVKCKLDKLTIMRLVLSYLQLKHDLEGCDVTEPVFNLLRCPSGALPYKPQSTELGDVLDESRQVLGIMNGFVSCISSEGHVLYVSENVKKFLGFQQVDMIGKDVLEFVHPVDENNFNKQLRIREPELTPTENNGLSSGFLRRNFHVHMGCCFQESSRVKKKGFLPIHWTGKLLVNANYKKPVLLICICRPLDSTPLLEIRGDGSMFRSRMTLDLKYIFVEPRIINIVGYEPNELIGRAAYYFHCPSDAKKLRKCHKTMLSKGTGQSSYYRFLGKNTDWIWMRSKGSIVYNTEDEPQYISCTTFIVSEDEAKKKLEEEKSRNKKCLPPPPDKENPQENHLTSENIETSTGQFLSKVCSQQFTVNLPGDLSSDLQTLTLSELMGGQTLETIMNNVPGFAEQQMEVEGSQFVYDGNEGNAVTLQSNGSDLSGQSGPVVDVVVCTRDNPEYERDTRSHSRAPPPTPTNAKHKAPVLNAQLQTAQQVPVCKVPGTSELEKHLLKDIKPNTAPPSDSSVDNSILKQLLLGKITEDEALEISKSVSSAQSSNDLFSEIAMPLSPGSKGIMEDMFEIVKNIDDQDKTIFNYWSDSCSSMSTNSGASLSTLGGAASSSATLADSANLSSTRVPDTEDDYSSVTFFTPSTSQTAANSDNALNSSITLNSSMATKPHNNQTEYVHSQFVPESVVGMETDTRPPTSAPNATGTSSAGAVDKLRVVNMPSVSVDDPSTLYAMSMDENELQSSMQQNPTFRQETELGNDLLEEMLSDQNIIDWDMMTTHP